MPKRSARLEFLSTIGKEGAMKHSRKNHDQTRKLKKEEKQNLVNGKILLVNIGSFRSISVPQ